MGGLRVLTSPTAGWVGTAVVDVRKKVGTIAVLQGTRYRVHCDIGRRWNEPAWDK